MISATRPLKAGEILVPDEGSAWSVRWKQVKTVSSHMFKGAEYWWVEMTASDGVTHMDTMSVSTLRAGWKRKPTFYRIGKTYKFKERNGFQRTDTWYILDIYEVDNPLYGYNKCKAIGRMTTENGCQDIQTLSQLDFARMVEA